MAFDVFLRGKFRISSDSKGLSVLLVLCVLDLVLLLFALHQSTRHTSERIIPRADGVVWVEWWSYRC